MSEYDAQGSYELDYIRIVNYEGKETDITDMFMTMTLTQDLFSSCMFGEICIIDAIDLQQSLPIIGEEKLLLKFRTGEGFEWRTHEFCIYSMSDRTQAGNNSYSYSLKFTSWEVLKDRFTYIGRGFKSKKISEIVQSAFNTLESEKELFIEETDQKINYICTQQNPFYTINNMTWKAKSRNQDGVAYVFFEDYDGFHFESLETFFTREPVEYFVVDAKIGQDQEQSFYNVLSYEFVTQTNRLDLINKGMFGGTVQTFDPLTRTFGEVVYNYDTDFEKTLHIEDADGGMKFSSNLNDFRQEFQDAILKSMLSRQRTGSFVKDATFDNEWHTNDRNFLTRVSQLQQITNNIRLRLMVQGNTELKIGNIIDLKLPSNYIADLNDPALKEDKLVSGRYIINTNTLTFTKTSLFSILEVTKDCYKQDFEDAIREELFR